MALWFVFFNKLKCLLEIQYSIFTELVATEPLLSGNFHMQ